MASTALPPSALSGPRPDSERRIKKIGPPSFSPAAISQGFAALSQYRDLLLTLTEHRIKVRYKQSVLGLAWAILQPLSLMLIYNVIFTMVTRIPSEGLPYTAFVFSALLPWVFFSSALTASALSLVNHTQLITKVYFPREILPLTYVFAGLFDLCVASVVLAGLMAYYRIGLTAQVIWVIPVLLIAIGLTTSLSLILSAAQVRFRDIGLAMPLLMQLWMFATPVVYPLSQVPPRLRTFYVLNPVVGIVENFRRVIVQGMPPDMPSLWIAAGVTAVLLPCSYLFFKRLEATMADVI